MSIFKKKYSSSGNGDKISGDKKLDLEKLLSSVDINNIIIELDNYICELCAWGDNLDKLTEEQKNFYFNQNLEREINNGGFNQYFLNSSGDFAHPTVESLKIIGAHKTAELLQQAIDQFPDSTVPSNRKMRLELFTQIEKKADPVWQELDKMFFAYDDNLNALNINYVRQNKDKF